MVWRGGREERASGEGRRGTAEGGKRTGRRAAAACTRRRGESRQERSKQARDGTHHGRGSERGSPGAPQYLRGPIRGQHVLGESSSSCDRSASFNPQKRKGLGEEQRPLRQMRQFFCDRSAKKEQLHPSAGSCAASVWGRADPCRLSSRGRMKTTEISSYRSPRNRIRSSRSRPGGAAEIAKVLCAR